MILHGRYGSNFVIIYVFSKEIGVIIGSAIHIIIKIVGVKDVIIKSQGFLNQQNIAKATLNIF